MTLENKTRLLILAICGCALLQSCNSGRQADDQGISHDSVSIAKGQVLFNQQCATCHNFKQDGIGPALGGITSVTTTEWLAKFIPNAKASIEAGDKRAVWLQKNYITVMPPFPDLKKEEVGEIISYLNTFKQITADEPDSKSIKNPIEKAVELSDLVVELKPFIDIPFSSDKLPRTRITKMDFRPDTKQLFILDLRGKLYSLTGNTIKVFMDMTKLRPGFISQPGLATGFGSFAFHPDFATNGLIYTTHTELPSAAKPDFGYADSIKATVQWVLMEWTLKTPVGNPVLEAEVVHRELFRANMVAGIHGVQEIAFNPGAKKGSADYGLLYIGTGDGGAVENGFGFLAHDRGKIWGTILRVDPTGHDSPNGHYGIPATNPWAKSTAPGIMKEIYAYGFRNPHRFSWTSNGDMLAVNVGHSNVEALNIILPGHDYGWPLREGNFVLHPEANLARVYALPEDDSSFNFTYPVAQYDHGEGKAISGGFEYTGNMVPELKGKYLFGDIPTGRLFYVDVKSLKSGSQAPVREWNVSLGGRTRSLKDICGTDRVDVHFGKDAQGELYIMTKPDGKVYSMTATIHKK